MERTYRQIISIDMAHLRSGTTSTVDSRINVLFGDRVGGVSRVGVVVTPSQFSKDNLFEIVVRNYTGLSKNMGRGIVWLRRRGGLRNTVEVRSAKPGLVSVSSVKDDSQ